MERKNNKPKRYKTKKVNNMSTLELEKKSLSDFIKANKNKIYEDARRNTKLNANGKPTISRNDDWFSEDMWDNYSDILPSMN